MTDIVSYTLEDNMARVSLDLPERQVNILNEEFLQALERTAGRLAAEVGVKAAVVLSSKKGGFIAGADIEQIQAVNDAATGERMARYGQSVMDQWANLRFPVVAAVHGHCLGGGVEFILACHYRILASNAQISLPEVKLGLFPGFGGTQRLPRLISLEKALQMILTGRSVGAEEALKIGLADRCTTAEKLEEEAFELAREVSANPAKIKNARRAKNGGARSLLLEKNPLGQSLIFHQARKSVESKTGGHYPAPLKALEVIRQGLQTDLQQGLKIEARELGKILLTPVCKNLIQVYYLRQRAGNAPGIEARPRKLERFAVLGGGVMGRGIAYLFAERGLPIQIRDLKESIVESALRDIRSRLEHRAQKKRRGSQWVEDKVRCTSGTTAIEDLSSSDLVVEAVLEKMQVKQDVLREIEPLLPEGAVFATNTSALSVSELQKAAQRPENIGGLHFFNPAEKMPLVEVVQGESTSEETLATLFSAALQLGKTPIVTADRPGFLVNRLLVAYLNEACLIAEEGVDWHSLDVRATSFGLPMGPFRLLDEVGLDIAAEVGTTLSGAFGYLVRSSLLENVIHQKDLGRKTNKGFYLYQKGREIGRNEDLFKFLGMVSSRQSSQKDLRRMLLLMVNEGSRCLEEKVVQAPEDVDTGMIFGTGFPPFLGGLCRWADTVGLDQIRDDLSKLADAHGTRFQPTDYLAGRQTFY